MGSGISITKRQVIDIIKRELNALFEYEERMKNQVDENGYAIPDTFDKEYEYRNTLKKLDRFILETDNE
jgi:predicted DNA-binding protein YlxM (UPF0122 family)